VARQKHERASVERNPRTPKAISDFQIEDKRERARARVRGRAREREKEREGKSAVVLFDPAVE